MNYQLGLKRAVIILAVGIVLGALYNDYKHSISKENVKEKYWAETGLAPSLLNNMIQDQMCYSNEKYFLACVNSLDSVARRIHLTLNSQGRWVSLKSTLNQSVLSENDRLNPWKLFFNEKHFTRFSFPSLWQELQIQIPQQNLSYYTGLAVNGFLSILRDPHTYILPLKTYEDLYTKPELKTVSLGFYLDRDQRSYFLKKVLNGSVSESYGLKKNDRLIKINDTEVSSLPMNEVSELLKGQQGEKIELTVLRKDKKISITMIREERVLPLVSFQILDEKSKLAVLQLAKFNKGVCEKIEFALEELNKKSIRGLILDLRDNPGGHISEASCIAGLFLGPYREIFRLNFIDKNKPHEKYISGSQKKYSGPMAILINSGTASAAEILAGSLRDYSRAQLMGSKTFGKGSVQEGDIWNLNSKMVLFETVGFFQLPAGNFIQGLGITPDILIGDKQSDKIAFNESSQYLYPFQIDQWNHLAQKSGVPFKSFIDHQKSMLMLRSAQINSEVEKQTMPCVLSGFEKISEDPELQFVGNELSCQKMGRVEYDKNNSF